MVARGDYAPFVLVWVVEVEPLVFLAQGLEG